LVRKTIYLKQNIQKIYSEKNGMCSNDINGGKNNVLVKKKWYFGKEHNRKFTVK